MLYVTIIPLEEGKGEIGVTYYDEKYVPEGVQAYAVDAIPEPPVVKSHQSYRQYINPETLEIWYEVFDVGVPSDEAIQSIQERIDLMQQALDYLLMGGIE